MEPRGIRLPVAAYDNFMVYEVGNLDDIRYGRSCIMEEEMRLHGSYWELKGEYSFNIGTIATKDVGGELRESPGLINHGKWRVLAEMMCSSKLIGIKNGQIDDPNNPDCYPMVYTKSFFRFKRQTEAELAKEVRLLNTDFTIVLELGVIEDGVRFVNRVGESVMIIGDPIEYERVETWARQFGSMQLNKKEY